jgi:hypothetical protein
LSTLLNKNYELYSVVKPGSSSSELNPASEVISQMSYSDFTVICSGTNDSELNGDSLTLQHISKFIKYNKHTYIVVMNVPFIYDPPNSTSVNNSIFILNRKIKKLVKAFPHTNFLEIYINRK